MVYLKPIVITLFVIVMLFVLMLVIGACSQWGASVQRFFGWGVVISIIVLGGYIFYLKESFKKSISPKSKG